MATSIDTDGNTITVCADCQYEAVRHEGDRCEPCAEQNREIGQ